MRNDSFYPSRNFVSPVASGLSGDSGSWDNVVGVAEKFSSDNSGPEPAWYDLLTKFRVAGLNLQQAHELLYSPDMALDDNGEMSDSQIETWTSLEQQVNDAILQYNQYAGYINAIIGPLYNSRLIDTRPVDTINLSAAPAVIAIAGVSVAAMIAAIVAAAYLIRQVSAFYGQVTGKAPPPEKTGGMFDGLFSGMSGVATAVAVIIGGLVLYNVTKKS